MKAVVTLFLTINCFFLFAQPGRVDTIFNSAFYNVFGTGNGFNAFNSVLELCEQPDGKLILAGGFGEYNGVVRYGMARVNMDGSLDATFDPGITFQYNTFYWPIRSLALQTDGKIIVVRTEYNGFSRSVIRRLNTDGTIDTTAFTLGEVQYGEVQKSFLQPDGKLILCGDFTYQDTTLVDYNDFVRINPDGTVDQTFVGGINFNFPASGAGIRDLKLDAQGKILVGGEFDGFNGINVKGIIRFNANGTLDSTFNTGSGMSDYVYSIAIQPDDKILVGGNFISYQGTYANGIVRLNPDASIDGTFQLPGGFRPISHINVMPDSTIVFLGNNTFPALSNAFVRLNGNGTLDTVTNGLDVGPQGFNSFTQFKALGSGKMVVIGQFDDFQGKYRGSIARIDSNFRLDPSFKPKPGFKNEIQKTLVQPDGKIYVGRTAYEESDFTVYNDRVVAGLIRINVDGSLDTTFHIADSLFVSVEAMARQNDGKIVVAGMTRWFDGSYNPGIVNLARFNQDGSIDSTFMTYNFNGFPLNEVLIQSDGKIIILGKFSPVLGMVPYTNLARFNSDGTLDNSFNIGSGANDEIKSGLITNSGKILIGGSFTSYNGIPMQRFGSLNPDGSIDASFAFNGHVFSEVKSIKKQSDGKIYLTAQTLSTNNNIAVSILRLNINGSVDNSFAEVFNGGDIKTLLPLPDGKLLVGGDVYSLMGASSSGIARLNSDGTRDTTFYSVYSVNQPNVIVKSMSLGLDGKVVIGGNFSKVAGTPSNNLAVLNNDLDAYFDVSFTDVSNISCSGNGTVTAFASGGTPPYLYSWQNMSNPSDSAQVITDAGIYTCLVQDAAGIISSASLLIDGPASSNGFDLKANLTAGSFRTGFNNTIVLTALNDGCIPTSGQLICVMDSLVHFNSAVPTPSYQNNDTLIWDFSNLTYDSGYLIPVINSTVSTTAQIGDTVSIHLLITPASGDMDTTNNSRDYFFPVINGYDPNIKSVYPVGKCDEGYIENRQKLTYTVQFQNTGNSEAINIVVVDSLDEDLDVNSLHIVGNSHEIWVEVVQNNTVKFHFDLINLPDSSTNEVASHGYLTFEINPVSDTLSHNTIISNKAEIYFDFNPAIVTNSCNNTIYDGNLNDLECDPGNNLAVEELSEENNFYFYPNPTSDRIRIKTNSKQEEMILIVLTDLSGKEVNRAVKDPDNDLEVDLTSLETGTYLLIMRSVSGELVNSSRIVKI